jgi:hypothetical protein
MRTLRLSHDLTLPLTAVTETFGILAARGAGKSNLAAVMAEQMFDAGLPFVVVDPVGAWFGLRAGADGSKDGGLAIPIFGGKHGDVPLERHGGELLADLIASKRLSCVLDVSNFESESAKKQFLLDFARRLYLKNEDPLHLFLEEADDYIPQRPMGDEAQLLRAWENIVRRGRARGLGLTLITQRSASLNKNVLTQVQTLFVLRTTGPQDRAAIEAWVKYHDTDETLLSSLSGLKPGEGWVWSPQFLETMSRHQFHRRRTFDSGATPKNLRGKEAKPVATLADVDLAALTERMAATIERAKAEDPKELRRELARVRHELQQAQQLRPVNQQASARPVDLLVLTDGDRELLKSLRDEFLIFSENIAAKADLMLTSLAERATAEIEAAAERWTAEVEKRRALFLARLEKARVQKVLDKIERVSSPVQQHNTAMKSPARSGLTTPMRPDRTRVASPAASGGAVNELGTSGAYRMLVALAQESPEPMTLSKLALRSGIARNGGTFRTYLGKLRTLAWAEGNGHGVRISDVGLSALGQAWDPLPSGHELIAYWQRELGDSGARRMFDAIVEAYPRSLTAEQLEQATNIAAAGGTFRTYLGKLRTLELVTRREIRASEELFG